MTKIIQKILLLLFVLVSVVLVMVNMPLKYAHDLSIVVNKFDLLASKKDAKKIVFVGGSGLSVGIDSAVISRELNYDVVNVGVYAGYGINAWLEESKRYLKPGDVVVIIPEFAVLLNKKSFWPNDRDTMKWFLAADSYLAIRQMYLRADNYKLLLRDISELFKDRIWTIGYALRNRTLSGVIGKGRIDSSGSNEYGDVIVEVFKKIDPHKFEDHGKVYLSNSLGNDKITDLNRFDEYFRQHNIKAFFMYSCYPQEEYLLNKDQFTQIDRQLRRAINMEVLGDPSTFILPVSYFTNSNNHLDTAGKKLRTELMVDFLRAGLNLKSK